MAQELAQIAVEIPDQEADARANEPVEFGKCCSNLFRAVMLCTYTLGVILIIVLSTLTMQPCEVFHTDEISDIVAMITMAMMMLGGLVQLRRYQTYTGGSIFDEESAELEHVYSSIIILATGADALSFAALIWGCFSHPAQPVYIAFYFGGLCIFMTTILMPPRTLVTNEYSPSWWAFLSDFYLLALCDGLYFQVNFLEAKETLLLYDETPHPNCTRSPFRKDFTAFHQLATFTSLEEEENDYEWYDICKGAAYAITVEVVILVHICYFEQKRLQRLRNKYCGNETQTEESHFWTGLRTQPSPYESVFISVEENPSDPECKPTTSTDAQSSTTVSGPGDHAIPMEVPGASASVVTEVKAEQLPLSPSDVSGPESKIKPHGLPCEIHQDQANSGMPSTSSKAQDLREAGIEITSHDQPRQLGPVSGTTQQSSMENKFNQMNDITLLDKIICAIATLGIITAIACMLVWHIQYHLGVLAAQSILVIITKFAFFAFVAFYLLFPYISLPCRVADFRDVSSILDIRLLRWSAYGDLLLQSLFFTGAFLGPFVETTQSWYNFARFVATLVEIWIQYSFIYLFVAVNKFMEEHEETMHARMHDPNPASSAALTHGHDGRSKKWKWRLRCYMFPLLLTNFWFWGYDLWQWKTVRMLSLPAGTYYERQYSVWAVIEGIVFPVAIFFRFHSMFLCWSLCHISAIRWVENLCRKLCAILVVLEPVIMAFLRCARALWECVQTLQGCAATALWICVLALWTHAVLLLRTCTTGLLASFRRNRATTNGRNDRHSTDQRRVIAVATERENLNTEDDQSAGTAGQQDAADAKVSTTDEEVQFPSKSQADYQEDEPEILVNGNSDRDHLLTDVSNQ